MKEYSLYIVFSLLIFYGSLSSCKLKEPLPLADTENFSKLSLLIGEPFAYDTVSCSHPEGFKSSSLALYTDTLVLKMGRGYPVRLMLIDEQQSPAKDITPEILLENEEHIFIWENLSTDHRGSVIFSGGNIDSADKQLNQKGYLTTGTAGAGSIKISLIHRPTNKFATTSADAGGILEGTATFPVVISP